VGRTNEQRLIVALAAVDAVLLVMLVVLAVSLPVFRAAPVEATSPSPTSTGVMADQPTDFRMPSGNIACRLTEAGVTCMIDSFSYAAPPAAGCTGKVGEVVVLDADGARAPCPSEVSNPMIATDANVLEYGRWVRAGDYRCQSSQAGVLCTRESLNPAGFRLSRTAFEITP